MKKEHANGVVVLGWSTATDQLDIAPSRVQRVRIMQSVKPVYDLQVDEHHEFIAECVLVHNSMAGLRYFCHNRHVVERALVATGSSTESRPAAAEDEGRRPAEREAELERGIRVIRHGPGGANSNPRTRGSDDMGGIAGAEDSPLRSHSDRINSPEDLRERAR
jgi:hypothetical protein